MVSQEELFEVWDIARRDFYNPSLPRPVITSGVSGITILPTKDWASFIDMKKYQVFFNPGCLSLFSNWKRGARNIFGHEIGHYIYCPYDEGTASRLVISALDAIEQHKKLSIDVEQAASMCCNFHNDYGVDLNRINRGLEDLVISQTTEIVESIKKRKGVSTVWQTFVRGYELLWDADLHLNLKDERLEDCASEIELLLKKEWNVKEKWPRQVYRITEIFLPLLLEEQQKTGDMSSSELTEQMYGDPTVIKYKDKETGQGDLEDVVKKTGSYDDPQKMLDKFKQIVKILRGPGKGASPAFPWMKDVIFHEDLIKLWYKEKEKIDFRVIPLKEKGGSPIVPVTPETWHPSKDSLRDLDFLQTKSTYPRILPGISTKKWEYQSIEGAVKEKEIIPNYLAALDTSGSMGEGAKYFVAAYTAFKTSDYVILKGGMVAPLNFSNNTLYNTWTRDMDLIMKFWASEQAGGTELAGDIMLKLNETSNRPVINSIITDTQIYNFSEVLPYIEKIMGMKRNQLVLFKVGHEEDNKVVRKLKELGCEIYSVNALKDLDGVVLGRVRKAYEYAIAKS
jgi:hypothetical protein